MQNVDGTDYMSYRSVFQWWRDFHRGRNSTDDRLRPDQAHAYDGLLLRKYIHHQNIDLPDIHSVPLWYIYFLSHIISAFYA